MADTITDSTAWQLYPEHRWVYNKLELALKLNHDAGPAGVAPHDVGYYVVRPVYNISGMGTNSRLEELTPDDLSTVAPGEFWCELFNGPQISVDYEWHHGKPTAVFASQGYRTHKEMYRFNAWSRCAVPDFELPKWIRRFHNVPRFNIEFVGGKIIEIHLRSSNDFPPGATQIIPVWEDSADEQHSYMRKLPVWNWIDNEDDADGHLPVKRLGFYWR